MLSAHNSKTVMIGKKQQKTDWANQSKVHQVTSDRKRVREVEPCAPAAVKHVAAPVAQVAAPAPVLVAQVAAPVPAPVAQVAAPVPVLVAQVAAPVPVLVAQVAAPTSVPTRPQVVCPQIERAVTVAATTSLPWTEAHRPSTVVRVIGNSKAKEAVQQWFVKRQWQQPLLIAGPNGVGKTSLAHAACRDYQFIVQECSALPGDLLVVVQELLYRKGTERVALVLDEVHTYTAGERTALAKLLKRPLAMPVILVCDELDKSMDALKSVCKVVRMYRQVVGVGDVTLLTSAVLRAESKGLYPAQLNLIHQAACGDLRRCTIMLELACKTRRCRATDERADLFVESLFDATSSVLYQKPRAVNFEQGVAMFKQHDLMTWMVHENYSDACDLDAAVSLATYFSDVDALDSHPSHHCHEHASTLACAAVMASAQSTRFASAPRVTFPAALGMFSRRKSFKNTLHEDRLSWLDWRVLGSHFSLLQQATSLTTKELSKLVNSYSLTDGDAL